MITVLIADRHDLFRRSLRQLCETNGGFNVVAEATTAAEALALASRLRPDVALVDMRLAELDGAETMRLLRAVQPELVTILLAFSWDDETLERARLSGARAWLPKDCDEATLFDAIRTSQPPILRTVPPVPEQNPAH